MRTRRKRGLIMAADNTSRRVDPRTTRCRTRSSFETISSVITSRKVNDDWSPPDSVAARGSDISATRAGASPPGETGETIMKAMSCPGLRARHDGRAWD